MAAITGTNHAVPNDVYIHSLIAPRISPAWLKIASRPSSAASIRRTPMISRACRVLSRGRVARLLRLEREEEARRPPDRAELRDVVRRMLRALEPSGFYAIHLDTQWPSIHSTRQRSDTGSWWRSDASATCRHARSVSRCATSPCSTAKAGGGCWGRRTESGTAARTSDGCRLIHRAASSARRAGTTTWDA